MKRIVHRSKRVRIRLHAILISVTWLSATALPVLGQESDAAADGDALSGSAATGQPQTNAVDNEEGQPLGGDEDRCESCEAEVEPRVREAIPPPTVAPRNLRVFTLENGLTVILDPDRSYPRIAVAVTYAAGERHQPSKARGLARVTERLMVEGSRNVAPGEHELVLEHAGATAVGSWTSLDGTTYFEEVPAHHLATALWLESDRMASLLARVDEAALERARRAATLELARRREMSAVAGLDEIVTNTLFPAGHPYRRRGDRDRDIAGLRLEHVQWFVQRRLAPQTARLAIVGDFDPDQAQALVERYFGSIRSNHRSKVRTVPSVAPSLDGEHRINYGALVSSGFVRVVWPTPPFLRPGDAELDYVAYLLGQGRLSRLHRQLVEGDAIATSVWAWQASRELASEFSIQVRVAEGRGAEEVLQGIDRAVQELCTAGPDPLEFERVRRLNFSRELIESTGLVDRASTASRIVSPLSDDGVFRLEQNLARYAAVTPATVREAACHSLVPRGRVVVFVVPDDDAPRVGHVLSSEVLR